MNQRKSKLLGRLIGIAVFGTIGLSAILSRYGGNGDGLPPGDAEIPAAVAALSQTWGVAPEGSTVALAANVLAKSYYVVLDGSGSMSETTCAEGGTKAEAAKAALLAFAQSVPGDAYLGLLVFDRLGVTERVALARNNLEAFNRAVRAMEPGGTTPLLSAMTEAVKRLEVQAVSQRGYGDYNLVVVTDGEASEGEDPSAVVGHLALRTPVTLHTIGFCIGAEHSLNQPGRAVYRSATSVAQLQEGLTEVLAESETFDVSGFERQ